MLLYRMAITVLAPVVALVFLWRLIRGRIGFSDISERLGGGAGTAPALWLHGASNGELTSAKPLISALLQRLPDTVIVVTCNTQTGKALIESWDFDRITARLAPVDYRWALRRFIDRWQPIALISLENEMWPNRIATLPCPVICIAARMSERSAARWARLPGLMRAMLGNVAYLVPQDSKSGDRFAQLGLKPVALGPAISLKQAVTLPAPNRAVLDQFSPVFSRADTVLAASTHAGEEEVILDAFVAAKTQKPALKLILAPRHPKRSAQILALITARALSVATRSAGDAVGSDTDVYLVDTLGEMPNWYALAGITFVGGSLVAKGGHTPFEPAAASTMILHGPHLENFAAAYGALAQDGAALQIATVDGLAAILVATSDAQQREFARAAQSSLAQFQTADDAVETLSDKIVSLLS